MKNRLFGVLFLVFMLAGCATVSNVSVKEMQPELIFKNVPKNTYVLIDNRNEGNPSIYDGKPETLIVEPGVHNVVILNERGSVVYSSDIFVQDETKVIYVR